MAPLPKPTPWKITGPGGDVIAWASNTTALKKFFASATKLTSSPGASKTVSIKGHTYRQYPGDPTPLSRGNGSKQVYPERWLSNGTTPGTVFWCETTTTDGTGKPKKVRSQFTYQGSFGDLKAAARAQTTVPFVLRNASGRAYPIVVAGSPPANPMAPEVFEDPLQ
jgi:hypothetical protein